MSQQRFDTYFHERSSSFARFYRSETVTRLLGRGPLFERLRYAVDECARLELRHVLDVGCGSGPLFAPLAERGIRVTAIEPAPAMLALARQEAARIPGGVVQVDGRGWEDVDESDAYDVAVALGIFDYVMDPTALLSNAAQAARYVIGSFPSHSVRTTLRDIRYRRGGVRVRGYRAAELAGYAAVAGLEIERVQRFGRAGFAATLARRSRS
jgi:2-polyprenyl-3-methyl-5-hydroxy-6-metoxy-1,4-benzoquinol methylase